MHQPGIPVNSALPIQGSSNGERATSPPGKDLKKLLRELETQLVLEALRVSGGHQRRAARWLGVSPTNLNARMKRLGIAVERVLTYGNGEDAARITAGRDRQQGDES